MERIKVCFWLLSVVCMFKGASCISCLSCGSNGQAALTECAELVECGPTEACYIEQVLPLGAEAPVFKAGCRALEFCNIATCTDEAFKGQNASRKRQSGDDMVICSKCCYHDFCNVEGCGGTQDGILRCFDCRGIDDTTPCLNMKTCDSHSECASEVHSGELYTLKCISQKFCAALALVHNSETVCCNSSLCNGNPKVNRTVNVIDNTHTCPPSITRASTTRRTTITPTTPLVPTSPASTSVILTPTSTTTVPPPPTTTTTTPNPTTTTTPNPTTTTTTPNPTTTTTTPIPTTTTTPKPTTTTPQPTTTTTTPKPTTTATPIPTTTTTPKPTTTTTTPTPTTTTTTPKPTTTTTPKPTTTTTTPKPTTPTTTIKQAYQLPPVPTQCKVCDPMNGPDLCEYITMDQQCDPPNNYCITYYNNLSDGSRTVNKTCGNFDTCYREWFLGTSDNDKCDTVSVSNFPELDFQCTFCCIADDCNDALRPPDATLYRNTA